MKKNFVYAMMSAIALTGAVSFSACSSNEEVADVNPTFDGNSVRTDFAFSITKASKTTRMAGEDVQEAGNGFLGMSHMFLLPFSEEPAAGKSTNISSNPEPDYTNFALGSLLNTEISETNSKKIYSMTLPIGTNNFLFYGKATRGNKDGFTAGRLTSSFFDKDDAKKDNADDVSSTNDIEFSLVNIADGLGSDATNLAAYLNTIVAAKKDASTWAGTVAIVANQDGDNPGAYTSLADLYTKFTTYTSDRCGSAEAVLRTLQDLYKSAKAINDRSSIQGVKDIAEAIMNAIKDGTANLSMQITDTDTDPDKWTFAFRGSGLSDTKFPTVGLKLPMGAAQLNWDESGKKFVYKSSVSEGPEHSGLHESGIPVNTICYPSELIYYDNSPLRATEVYKTQNDYSGTPVEWDKQYLATTGDWTLTAVTPATRAVAMKNNVNYGVALLETTVKLKQAALTDNRATILGGSATDQTDITGTGMTVTGIIIGGQPASVGWNMVNKTTAFDYAVYDRNVQYGTNLTTSNSNPNYTVVLDNYTISTSGQQNVNFALEIKNGEKDFYGKNGMIPAGHTFYLLGTMDLSTGSGRVTPKVVYGTGESDYYWRTAPASGYRITEEATNRVFLQDYKTVANITIKADALQSAYSSIPDLRSTELLFGLSVDLKWEQGLKFNVEI